MVLPQSLVLDIIELDQAALTDALDPEGVLKNIVFFWDAVADVYGSTGTSSQTEAKRLDLLMEWSLLLTALPGSSYPGMKLLGSRYRHERGRLALTKLRKEKVNFAHAMSGLQLVQEREATLGLCWDIQSASFTRNVESAGEGLNYAAQPQHKCGGKAIDRDPKFSVAASIARAAEKPNFNFELFGNWQDHWSNTVS